MANVLTDINAKRYVDTVERSDGKNALVVESGVVSISSPVQVYSTITLPVYTKQLSANGEVVKSIQRIETIAGSAGTGASGSVSRVYTMVETDEVAIHSVYLDGLKQDLITDFTYDNTAKTITFSSSQHVFNSQTITVVYYV